MAGADAAPPRAFVYSHVVDAQQVRDKLQGLLKQQDLSKYIM
jgi:ATP-dependent protease HslVU (ClpYQ) ATPase subunit